MQCQTLQQDGNVMTYMSRYSVTITRAVDFNNYCDSTETITCVVLLTPRRKIRSSTIITKRIKRQGRVP